MTNINPDAYEAMYEAAINLRKAMANKHNVTECAAAAKRAYQDLRDVQLSNQTG